MPNIDLHQRKRKKKQCFFGHYEQLETIFLSITKPIDKIQSLHIVPSAEVSPNHDASSNHTLFANEALQNPAHIQLAELVTTAIFQPDPEQKKRFTAAIKIYKIRQKSAKQNPDSLTDKNKLLVYVRSLTEHPNFMRYMRQEYPNMVRNIIRLKEDYYHCQEHYIPDKKQEKIFLNAIQGYRKRREAYLKNPNVLETKRTFNTYAKALTEYPNFMMYLQKRHPKMAKKIISLSKMPSSNKARIQSQDQDLSLDIEI